MGPFFLAFSPLRISRLPTFRRGAAHGELNDRILWFYSFFTSLTPALLIISTVDSDKVVASRPNDNPRRAAQVNLTFLQSDSYDALQKKELVACSLLMLTNSR